ncbi:fluoride efflux transporter FluC [Streptomyces profundus]|uniref:fluoride efflux transporter FluC n=1 Tax=Streptomyces profundus TaxID=2867410 RepID=UPI001D165FB2|nr:CrcB family protein [Streptomyces sp. MA3_2.13]UED85935.1 CrcB family protein [Streptomyces sp. MA3_2.13]
MTDPLRNGPQDPEPVDPDVPLEPPVSRAGTLAGYGAVAAGGALGALARFGAGRLWPTAPGAFPWTTLAVNAVGCLLIGCLLVAATELWSARPLLRPFAGTGLLGGFTTFSTYAVDARGLFADGSAWAGLGVLAGTVAAALIAVTVGAWGARRALRPVLARRAMRAKERR